MNAPPADHTQSPILRVKGVVLFIHGFLSGEHTWQPMLSCLREDPILRQAYDFATFSYTSNRITLNPLSRNPSLAEVVDAFADRIDSPEFHDRPLTLVGHSQGGLVIQGYFAKLVKEGHAAKLRFIRQAVVFATPSAGSATLGTLRRWLAWVMRNPQELTLRVLNEDVAEIRSTVQQRIVDAVTDSDTSWRVPTYAFYGLRDNVVPKASVRGVFGNVKAIEGTHLNLYKPKNRADRRYLEFAEVLADPGGHAHRFEIARYHNRLEVEPRSGGAFRIPGKRPRDLVLDNVATLTRSVVFARSNRCERAFRIGFDVREGAYLAGRTSHENMQGAEERGRGEDTGRSHEFLFRPVAGTEFTSWVEMYNAFGAGRRNLHFHLHSYDAHMREISYELDLSAYLAKGHRLRWTPRCRYSPERAPTCEFCEDIRMRDPLPGTEPRPGVFEWRFYDLEGGVVDIEWDLDGMT